MRKNNKGLTLIELVVTIAIIAIFSGVVVSLIGLGSNTYRATSGNAKIQMETQEAADQIQNLIIDANRSVYYAECSVDGGYSFTLGNQIQSDVQESSGGRTGTVSKAFVVCNEQKEGNIITYQYDVIVWDANSHKIIYTSKEATAIAPTEDNSESGEGAGEPASANAASDFAFSENDATGDGENQANGIMPFSDEESEGGQGTSKIMDSKVVVAPAVLAEDITDFCADTTLVLSDQIVRFQLFTEKSGKKINVLNTVNLRNPIKVAAPDESFGSAAAVDGKISILVPSKPLKPGDVYTFSTYTVGDVDPTTIRWYSKDPDTGFFQSSDLTLGKIFISEDPASNTLTIYVKAKTSSGREITSNEVTITIEKPAAEVTGIEPSQDTVLFGVNTGRNENYSLSNITWDEVYSDGTKKPIDASRIKWSCSGNPYISVDESGNVTVYPTAGDSQNNAVFNVNATYTGENENITGSITVKLARLDIESPSGVYHVGDTKEIKTVYREGGVIIDGIQATVTAAKKDSSGGSFNAGEKFVNDDIGDWNVNAIADTSGRNVNGAVSASGEFQVLAREVVREEANIKLSGSETNDMIFAGDDYICSYYTANQFQFNPDLKGNRKYKLVWNIEGGVGASFENDDNTISSDTNSSSNINLKVTENAKGFILTAELTVYDGATDDVAIVYTGRKNVKVVNKAVITRPEASESSPVVNGERYELTADVYASQIVEGENGSYTYRDVLCNYDGRQEIWKWKNVNSTNKTYNKNENGYWEVPYDLKSATIVVDVTAMNSVVKGNKKSGKASGTKDIEVQPANSVFEIINTASDDAEETTIYTDEKVSLKANLTVGNKNMEGWRFVWSCTDGNGASANDALNPLSGVSDSNFSVQNREEGKQVGTYTVKATCTPERDDLPDYEATYTIHVVDRIKLSIKDQQGKLAGAIYNGGVINLNASLSVEGQTPDNPNLVWKCIGEDGQTYEGFSGNGTSVTFTAPVNMPSGNYKITAVYTTEDGKHSKTSNEYALTILEPQVEFKIYEIANRTSVNKGAVVGFGATLYVNGKEITDETYGRVNWNESRLGTTIPGRGNSDDRVIKITAESNITVTAKITVNGVTREDTMTVTVTSTKIRITNKNSLPDGKLMAGESFDFDAMVSVDDEDNPNREDYTWSCTLSDGTETTNFTVDQEGVLTIPEDIKESIILKITVFINDDPSIKDSVLVNVFPKEKVVKNIEAYYVSPLENKIFGVDQEDKDTETCNITVTVNYTSGEKKVLTQLNSIPGMTLSVAFSELQMSALMADSDSLSYISNYSIVAEMDDSIYYYTIIPVVNNVYYLKSDGSYEDANLYVPAPEAAIGDKNTQKDSDGYSYVWTNTDGQKFYLRQSSKASTGTSNDLSYIGDSKNCWFMKGPGNRYYKYRDSGWYEQKFIIRESGWFKAKIDWDDYWSGKVNIIVPFTYYWYENA